MSNNNNDDADVSWAERVRAATPSDEKGAALKARIRAKMRTVIDRRGREWKMPTRESILEERNAKVRDGQPE